MIWVIIAIGAVVVVFFAMKTESAPTARQTSRDAQARAAALPSEEQQRLAAEVRATALDSYDRIAAAARQAGKDDAFAHQAGVLQAMTAVTSPGREPAPDDQRELQLEMVPFNKVPPSEGRSAVAEYLAWKFFPAHADEDLFAPSLRRFRDELLADDGAPEDVVYGMLHSMKYDWQRWLSDHRDADDNR